MESYNREHTDSSQRRHQYCRDTHRREQGNPGTAESEIAYSKHGSSGGDDLGVIVDYQSLLLPSPSPNRAEMSSREPLWYCHEVCSSFIRHAIRLTSSPVPRRDEATHGQLSRSPRSLVLIPLFLSDARSCLCLLSWRFRRKGRVLPRCSCLFVQLLLARESGR